ncbi:MAG: cytochrome P450 [Myxococcota bacterium]|nr:cytochrome P450 [Myxococcota bacterium]
MGAASEISIDDFSIFTPKSFGVHGYPFEQWDRLRRESPIHFFDEPELPYWAITKHEDITSIGRQPDLFLNGPLLFLNPNYGDEEFPRPKTLIEQDNPLHRASRKLISNRFTPRALKSIHSNVETIAKDIVEELLEQGDGEVVDFVEKVSAPLPIAVIAWLLGVPETMWKQLFDWTNQLTGADDPEYNSGGDKLAEAQTAIVDMFTYFTELVEERRKDPRDDLITVFTRAEIDGKPLELLDILAWCQIIMVAGNETTRNATSGGLLAFIEHPGELRKLQADPSLMKPAIEEVVRWSSPIIHFARTLSEDTVFKGVEFKKGDVVALYYPSANRDEDIFDAPYEFRVDRKPNRHIGFGVGEHFCAGAHVARLELEMAYKYLLPRIEEIELAGDIDRLQSNLIGGIKRMPIRYKLKPA